MQIPVLGNLVRGCRTSHSQSRAVLTALVLLITLPSCDCATKEAPRAYLQESDWPAQFFRLDANASAATFHGPQLDRASFSGMKLEFEPTDAVSWTPEPPSSQFRLQDGNLQFESDGAGAITTTGSLHLPAAKIRAIILRARVKHAERLSVGWRTEMAPQFLPENSTELPMTEPGSWKTYVIVLSQIPAWEKHGVYLEGLRIHAKESSYVELAFLKLVPDDLESTKEPFGSARRSKQNEDRPCIFLRTPGELIFPLRLFPVARFSAGLSLVDPEPAVTCSVIVESGSQTNTVFETRLETSTNWQDVNCDLRSANEGSGTIVLRVNSPNGVNTVLWSNPIVYQPLDPRRTGARIEEVHHSGKSLRPNIVWYVIDALRPDHLEAYGYDRVTAPTIARLASEGLLFTRCFAPGTWSLPSVTSMLSGASPLTHGVCHAISESVPDDLPLLAESLRDAGYATASISENPHAAPKAGLGRGLSSAEQSYRQVALRGQRRFAKAVALSDATFDASADFVRKNADRPFFLFVHTVEPHEPYASPAMYRQFSKASQNSDTPRIDSYDDCIRWADANLNRFIAMLGELGVDQNTLLIVCADHGEGFTEQEGGTGHSGKPYFARIHVPLIIHWPGNVKPGSVVDSNVQLIDLPATLLDVIGCSRPPSFEGVSLKPLFAGAEATFLESRGNFSIGHDPAQMAWVHGDRLYLKTPDQRTLFNLSADPHAPMEEGQEVTEAMRRLDANLRDYLAHHAAASDRVKQIGTEDEVVVDAVEQDRLRALGYAG